ncbi:MAG TPA: MFS transporter [Pyrinomonadaceae bacterium]|nr:MFS transporter [Pyrinomonadaceae bacterium]
MKSESQKISPQRRAAAMRFIVCFGVVSLFADMTYEGAHSIIGPYLKDLGATAAEVGFVAGLGEMLAASLRFFSGRLADRTHAYWTITTLGYVLNLMVVPTLALAGSWQTAALLVVVERTGKSLRGPARDVLLSEATGVVGHGWGFAVHSAFDQTGALLGPLMIFFSVARMNNFGPAFWWLAVPAAGAFLALLVARAVRPGKESEAKPRTVVSQTLPKVFWTYVAAAGLLACGFIDFPLLAYHVQKMGITRPATIPLLYAVANGVSGLTALLFGRLFDRYGIVVLTFGVIVSMLALPLGFLGGFAGVVAAVACWGAGLGAQDATLRSGISQVVSMNKRGSAFGSFNAVFGVMWFIGSVVMGWLYDLNSIIALVVFGMAMQLAAALVFAYLRRPLAEAASAAS